MRILIAVRCLIRIRQIAAVGLVMMVLAIPTVTAAENNYEFLSTASGKYVPIRILDTDSMPIESSRGGSSNWGNKTLFENTAGGHLQIVYIPPGALGALNHYHVFHEWAWIMYGDFTNNESTHPDQVFGPLQRWVAGDFLDRPPYSLHGGERGRQKFMASQIGSVILIMEESAVGEGTFYVDPDCRDDTPSAEQANVCGSSYNPDYEEITHWATPRIIDTLNDMPFQPVETSPGLSIKRLVDDPSHGFRATMWFLEAGAETPEIMRAHYFKRAHQFNFIINGDLKIQAYRDANRPAETYTVGQNFLIERAPMSVFGLVGENATEGGAVWLEVTYAKGTTWANELTPIEQPNYILD